MTVPNVLNPFRDTARDYLSAGWRGTLILPYKEKEKPPSAFTGRLADYPSADNIKEWLEDGQRHNICVRLAGVTQEYEILGIDVDDYWKGDKKKDGGEQFRRLIDALGPLPDTWISSARTDGVSGIRYYLVPRGLAFRGKADKDIEIIQKRHRYAIVWPSIHPDGGTYWWFPPGVSVDKTGRGLWDGNLPDAKSLPLLPDAWIEYLSNNRLVMPKDGLIDMDTPVDEVYDWAEDTFHGEETDPPCSLMREKLDKHILKVLNSSTFHDLLINAHWNLMNLAFEGHQGWSEAVAEYEQVWANAVADRGGTTMRDLPTLQGELFRSRIQALRQIKAKVEDRVSIGARGIDPSCLKTGACGGAVPAPDTDADDDDPLSDVPRGVVHGVPDYEMNDDGNAKFFADMFSSKTNGPSMRFIDGMGWMVWHDGKGEVTGHWELDPEGDQVVRRMWQKVKDAQMRYAEACMGDWHQKLDDFAKGLNGVTDEDVKWAKALYMKWARFSEISGNNRQAENAIKATRSLPLVSIDVNSLDRNPFLLGVANGVLELGEEVRLRRAEPEDFITLNTHQNYEPASRFATEKWQDYLDTFLPNKDLQRTAQIALGHCLIGGNPEKILIVLKGKPNTGKSTMISAIESALGDYAQTVGQSIFQNHKLNPVLANAITKRVIVCSEFDEDDKLSASQVKRLTGGSDKIQAELKGSNITVEGVPQFVPILATNSVPQIAGADKALQNRLYVIPFNVVPSRIDKRNAAVIEKICGPAVLNWLVDGYKAYREMGELPVSSEIIEETQKFMSELDEIATFADECVERVKQESANAYVSLDKMYARFQQWWVENNFQRRDEPSKIMFGKRLEGLGFEKKQIRVGKESGKHWLGVRLRKEERSNVMKMPNLQSVKTTKPVSTSEPGDLI